MRKTLRTILICMLAVLMVFSMLIGCNKKGIEPNASLPESSEPEEEIADYNPLTGLDYKDANMKGKRPVCFMINNHKKAWPQNGISQADIIYETPVEGGLTRLLAVFGEYASVEKYGSVRSARHDFVELAMPLNPVFVHWGGSTFGYDALKQSSLDTIDGNMKENKYFKTDKTLKRALEHTRFLHQDKLQEVIADKGYNMNGTTPDAFKFAKEENSISYAGNAAAEVNVPVSNAITTSFTYDTATSDYTKKEYNEPTLDGNTGEPVHIKNVFILYDSIPLMADGEHVDLSLSSGSGYYVTNGTYTSITWSKGDKNSMLTFKLDSGEDLEINPGNSWVLFVPNNMTSKTVFS